MHKKILGYILVFLVFVSLVGALTYENQDRSGRGTYNLLNYSNIQVINDVCIFGGSCLSNASSGSSFTGTINYSSVLNHPVNCSGTNYFQIGSDNSSRICAGLNETAISRFDNYLLSNMALVDEADLKVSNSPTDNYILSYDSATGGFTWVVDATGGGAGNQTLSETLTLGNVANMDINMSGYSLVDVGGYAFINGGVWSIG